MPMYLYLGDITRMETDAIVNAAGTDLRRCPGICDAIFAAADTEKLERACRKLGRCRIGQAVATPGCGLPCRYIIHVAGPGWYGGEPRERFLLAPLPTSNADLSDPAISDCPLPDGMCGANHFPERN